jgi:sodium-dependent phosphate transporter
MFGMFCSCLSAGIWLMMATYFKWPVSTTHTTIGAILGFGIAAKGFDAVQWSGVIKIVASWFLSPIISGILSSISFLGIRTFILRKKNSTERLISFFPFLVVICMVIYTLFIVYKGTPVLKLDNIPFYMGILIALGVGVFAALITRIFYVPYLRKKAAKSRAK